MRLQEITEDDIYALVGHTLAGRGYDYYEARMVMNLKARANTITAEVAGSSFPSYTVKIWCDEDGLDGNCTCPYSQGFDVCKHVAAILFEWIYEQADEAADTAISEAEPRQGLENLSKEVLINLVIEAAEENDSLYQKLRVLIEKVEPGGETGWMREMKGEIRRICSTDPYSGWEYIDIGNELETTLQPLENAELTDQLEIYTYVLEQVHQTDEDYETDDLIALRDQVYAVVGNLLGDSDLPQEQKRKHLDKLIDIYCDLSCIWSGSELSDAIVKACSLPEDFHYAIEKVQDYEDDFDGAEALLAKLYLASGQDEAYLEIRRQNLDSDFDYLELAEFYQSRGKNREAIEIAEEGLDNLTHKAALYPLLEEQYEAQGDVPNLQRILMTQFKEFPSLELYQRLRRVSETAEIWETDLKRKLLAPLEKTRGYGTELLLAEIYIADGDYDQALRLSQRNNIGIEALSHIADGIAQTCPDETIAIYNRIVDDYLAVNGRDRYRAAAQFAARIKAVYLDILGDETAWNNYIRGIRSENRRRPALIDEFKRL